MSTSLEKWVIKQAELTKPDRIHWCDGSDEEARKLINIGISEEKINNYPIFTELNQELWPNAYHHRSHPTDVSRTEHLTYVCYPDKDTAGPNNNWMDPNEAKAKLTKLSDGCMRGKTMYVLPYMMGHPDSPYSKACIQITDVTYVAVSMRIMTRMSKAVVNKIGDSNDFVKGLHSVGDFDTNKRFIMHFPQENFVWSIGSGYGGNALLGKKCFSLRIASFQGKNEGWLAEHMIIIGIEDPTGEITYVAAALPSACGKTNLALMQPSLPGYKIWVLGDDIAWLNIGEDGRLWAMNPETGFFGVAPGTSIKTNPNMIKTLKAGTFFPTLFTNTAIDTDKNEPWWEGLSSEPPKNVMDWQGNKWNPSLKTNAAHPNSRFTVSISQSPTISKEFNNPKGVPISAIIFGSKRSNTVPLVYESLNWQHGVFAGASMGSETTAAATHQVGLLRRDPMAMLPFCGYNMADYFKHWLNIGKNLKKPPKIFFVNWFRLDEYGKFIWPGFGENIRVLKWITGRINNNISAKNTPIGLIPNLDDLDTNGLNIDKKNLEKLFDIDVQKWQEEAENTKSFLEQFGDRMPKEIFDELAALKNRL
ncbi:MAG: phosphoenolpyruvate carboxykinase [Elusimicrobia bacterium RIFOXYC2_FULL_34_12]|nr:MAG: phosphoenolpyruvate carboxykinase [Elusimicrobia bacterium RIFOXYC2_FULL_34_12]